MNDHALASRASRLGPYELFAKIGEGGMGTVYLAQMQGGLAGFNKLAVVKELRADLVGSSAFVNMFLDEARLAARLTHPNVVHTYGADEDAGHLYIAMEYLDGQPWSRVRHRLWANRTLPLAIHLRVLADALAGLHHAHELQDFDGSPLSVVHCDMSPHNLFVTYDGQVKVVDFGVARAAHVSRRVSPGLFLGKLSYCAPEQARGEEVDRRADIFAVGVMLWEALTGRRFATGDHTSAIRSARARGREPSAREVAPSIPRVLADICDRALSTSPADRFATAAEFREQLASYLAQHWRGADDLGALVAENFEQERARVRTLVTARLQGHGRGGIANLVEAAEGDRYGENTLAADLSHLASVTRLSDDDLAAGAEEVTVPTETLTSNEPLYEPVLKAEIGPARRVPTRQTWLAVAAGVVVASGLLWLFAGSDPEPAAQAKALAPDATAPGDKELAGTEGEAPSPRGAADEHARAEPSSPADAVQVVLQARPAEAVLTLDGKALPSNPYALRVQRADGLHRVTASAPGHRDAEIDVRFDQDRELSLELEPLGVAADPAPARRRRVKVARRTREPLASPLTVSEAPPQPRPSPEQGMREVAQPSKAPVPSEVDYGTRLPSREQSRPIYDEVPF